MKYLPFMRSVSVVPAGITKFREDLYPLELFTKEEAGQIIDMIETYQKICVDQHGLHFVHASDELYMLAERDFPEEERYDGYIQLENGVGMMRLFQEEFAEAMRAITSDQDSQNKKGSQNSKDDRSGRGEPADVKRTLTAATGELAFSVIQEAAAKLCRVC